jgi:hypothetical protein
MSAEPLVFKTVSTDEIKFLSVVYKTEEEKLVMFKISTFPCIECVILRLRMKIKLYGIAYTVSDNK